MIQLIGPGGAGKTVIGAALAERLNVRFRDLAAEFALRHGDISTYLDARGYEAYAAQNVALYLDLISSQGPPDVVALSSGFMTYVETVHSDYLALRQRIASSPLTFVLLPSVDFEACVSEIVQRQLRRPFARSAELEEGVIRQRFFPYFNLPARKVETMRPVKAVVAELVAAVTSLRNR